MKMKTCFMVLCILPVAAIAATNGADTARLSVTRMSMAGARGPNVVTNLGGKKESAPAKPTPVTPTPVPVPVTPTPTPVTPTPTPVTPTPTPEVPVTEPVASTNCRDEYRTCMDEFCLLDESEGYRCACSSNIEQSKTIINEIQDIQVAAEKLYGEGVEREKLGAKAALVFGQSEQAKKAAAASGISFSAWLKRGTSSESLDTDIDIGDDLYSMAANFCTEKLNKCEKSADMEQMLYSRVIVQDCKNFSGYLNAQKKDAELNKKTAEAAVRKARFEMLDTTNKYNRGECLLAYRSCIADKGGCGVNFENCLDAELLGRRSNACENVLDQCMAVRGYVLEDWAAESTMVLTEAATYADKNRRGTCLAKIQACLEDSCSTASKSNCLTNINVAAGICPIIEECNTLVPGVKASVGADLGFLRVKFCQNDIDKCLQEKCGKNYTAPECVGKKPSQIAELCPQDMFPSCAGESQFNIIVQSALLEMDYQMMQGCVNYFGSQLGAVCGTDMACLPEDTRVVALKAVPDTEAKMTTLREEIRENARLAVDDFFKKFEKDMTVAACKDAKKPVGRSSMGASVFNTAKLIGSINAEKRALRQLDLKIAELSKKESVEKARQNCMNNYKEEPKPDDSLQAYSYISRPPEFQESLRNCKVCRVTRGVEVGGESKGAAGMKAAAGGLAAGASAGTMVMPGWGTAIGGVVGAVGGFFGGKSGAGLERIPFEITSCEDINM